MRGGAGHGQDEATSSSFGTQPSPDPKRRALLPNHFSRVSLPARFRLRYLSGGRPFILVKKRLK